MPSRNLISIFQIIQMSPRTPPRGRLLAAALGWGLVCSAVAVEDVTSFWASVPTLSSLASTTLPPGCTCAEDSACVPAAVDGALAPLTSRPQ